MDSQALVNIDNPALRGAYPQEVYPIEACNVLLRSQDLWNQFHKLDTEMIITKNGRRMFPSIQFQLAHLDPNASYCIFLEMTLASRCRYKYSSSVGWTPAGNEEAQSPHRLYMHPESPSTGEQWMSQNISFGRVKLTNSSSPPHGHMVLSSMHKYQPRILILKSNTPTALGWAPMKTFTFVETQFIAVTAYQNEKITKLKIDHNPFAKGFRDNGKSSNKRKLNYNSSDDEIINVDDSDSNHQNESKRINNTTPQTSLQTPVQTEIRQNNIYKIDNSYHNYCPVMPFYNFGGYPNPYAIYGAPLFASSVPFYYPVQTPWRDNSTVKAEVKPEKKLTDFSIKAITGIS